MVNKLLSETVIVVHHEAPESFMEYIRDAPYTWNVSVAGLWAELSEVSRTLVVLTQDPRYINLGPRGPLGEHQGTPMAALSECLESLPTPVML